MPVIGLFSGAQCHGEEVARRVADTLGYRLLTREIVDEAAARFDVNAEQLRRAMHGPLFAFNKFTRRRERYVAFIKATLSDMLTDDNLVIEGFATLLIPREITHVMLACLLSDREHRIQELVAAGKSKKEAQRRVEDADAEQAAWTQFLFGRSPWDKSLYDVKIPMHQTSVEQAGRLLCENAIKEALRSTDSSRAAVQNFRLAARVEVALAKANHFHHVSCRDGEATITLDEYVLRREPLEKELSDVARAVPGVTDVRVATGPNFRPPSMFTSLDADLPSKVLLVDDERDFVLTLSERLEMRDMEPAIAYDGTQALSILKDEEPDVMVLDLRMPGIDGIEVLRNVKNEHPEVEVIILTGHGSERDRELCMELGAFSYLEKPVDIEVLAVEMKKAYEKIRERKA